MEVGGFVEPSFRVIPDEVFFRRNLSGKNVYTAKVQVHDPSGGQLKLEQVLVSSSDLKVSTSHEDFLMSKSTTEVYRGQYLLRTYTIDLIADLTKRKTSDKEWLTIKTNSEWKPEIRVPIEIEVEPAITARPSRLFFGIMREPTVRSIRLQSDLGVVVVEQVTAEHRALTLSIEKDVNGTLLKVNLAPGNISETLRGNIHLKCRVGQHSEDITIPYFAMIQVPTGHSDVVP